MKIKFLIISSFLTFSIVTANGQADTIRKKNRYYFWMNGGGQYLYSGNSLIGLQLGLNSSINQRHFIKLKGYIGTSTSWELFSIAKGNRLVNIANISLLYGPGIYISRTMALVTSFGPSYGSAFWRGSFLRHGSGPGFGLSPPDIYDDDKYHYFGLNIELTVMWPAPIFGGSLTLHSNIHKHSDCGISVCFILGKIRDKTRK